MTEQESTAWGLFMSQALGQLDAGIGKQNFVALGIDPSFQNQERLYVSKANKTLRWTYKTLNLGEDYQRIFSNDEEKLKLKFGKQVPTFQTIDGEIGIEAYRNTFQIVDNLALKSLISPTGIGLDGTSYSISIGNYMRETRYAWWETLPEEWADLKPIFQELMKNMELARIQLKE